MQPILKSAMLGCATGGAYFVDAYFICSSLHLPPHGPNAIKCMASLPLIGLGAGFFAGAATHLILKGAQKVYNLAEPFIKEGPLTIGTAALAIGAGFLTLKCAITIITGHSTITGSQNAVAIAACHFSQKGAKVVQSVAQSLLNLTPELKSIILGSGIGALATNNKLRPFIVFPGMGALAGGLLNLISKASQIAERAII